MSMINDALRRASDAAKTGSGLPPMPASPVAVPPPPLPSAPPFPRPPTALNLPPPPIPDMDESRLPPTLLTDEEPPRKSSRTQLILALALVVCVGIAAAVTLWEKKSHALKAAQQALGAKKIIAPEIIAAQTVAATAPAPATHSNAAPNPAPKIAAAMTTTAAVPVAPPPALVKFPPLRLQSIFYRPSNPSVLINGKTLYLSDEIQGVTVADITPASVTLVLSGQTNVLTLR